MTKRIALALGLLGAVLACTQNITVPTTVTVTQTQPGDRNGGIAPSPAPNGQIVFGEKIAEFGEVCPNNITPAEQNPRETRVGCNSAVTCSPTDRNGNVIKRTDSDNYVQMVSFKQLGGTGAGKFSQDDNAFNGHVVCTNTGVVVLECTLRDTATGATSSGGDGGTSNSPWSMNCVS